MGELRRGREGGEESGGEGSGKDGRKGRGSQGTRGKMASTKKDRREQKNIPCSAQKNLLLDIIKLLKLSAGMKQDIMIDVREENSEIPIGGRELFGMELALT
eukprot:757060-Hanusia_phi.AAC.1